MYIHKNGVSFRKIEKSDLSFLQDIKSESWWGTHSVVINNYEDQCEWFDSIKTNELFLIGMIENNPIGFAAFTDIDYMNSNLKISGSVAKKFRAKYAYDAFCAGLDFAFEMFNVYRCEAEVLEYNIVAKNLEVNKLGFVVEGIKRQSVFKSGKYYNSIILGMLRSEWAASFRVQSYGDSCNLNFSPEKFKKIISRYSV